MTVQRALPSTSDYAPETFGKPNTPSIPINGIISNTYANIAADEIKHTYEVAAKNYLI